MVKEVVVIIDITLVGIKLRFYNIIKLKYLLKMSIRWIVN